MSYLRFEIIRMWQGKNVYKITDRNKNELGQIAWYPAWQEYVFTASENTVWTWKWLDEISEFLEGSMREKEMKHDETRDTETAKK